MDFVRCAYIPKDRDLFLEVKVNNKLFSLTQSSVYEIARVTLDTDVVRNITIQWAMEEVCRLIDVNYAPDLIRLNIMHSFRVAYPAEGEMLMAEKERLGIYSR